MTRLGYLPDQYDSRDRRIGELLGSGISPTSCMQLANGFDILFEQSAESCVGFSVVEALYASWKYQGVQRPVLPSARFVWYNSRLTHKAENLNSGTYIRSAIKQTAKLGHCEESRCPSMNGADRQDYALRPFLSAYHQASEQRLTELQYARLDPSNPLDWKRALSTGSPVVYGIPVSEAYLALKSHSVYRGDSSMIVGGHAQCALGYDERGIIGPGTWGPRFGNGGWYCLSWDFVLGNASDAWSISVPSYYH